VLTHAHLCYTVVAASDELGRVLLIENTIHAHDTNISVCVLTHANLCYTVVAASDELGRVLLIDVEDFFVLRMWKGYRESECAWTEATLRGLDHTRTGSTDAGETKRNHIDSDVNDDDCDGEKGGRGQNLCLLIYAPRRCGFLCAVRL
jgi:hypothetical protein